jgi:hypothetical protein
MAVGHLGVLSTTAVPSLISQDASKAVISFPELPYFDGTDYYELNGQTILKFTGHFGRQLTFQDETEFA